MKLSNLTASKTESVLSYYKHSWVSNSQRHLFSRKVEKAAFEAGRKKVLSKEQQEFSFVFGRQGGRGVRVRVHECAWEGLIEKKPWATEIDFSRFSRERTEVADLPPLLSSPSNRCNKNGETKHKSIKIKQQWQQTTLHTQLHKVYYVEHHISQGQFLIGI